MSTRHDLRAPEAQGANAMYAHRYILGQQYAHYVPPTPVPYAAPPSPPIPETGYVPSPPREGYAYTPPPRNYVPVYVPPLTPATPPTQPLPEPVAAAHPSEGGTNNVAFWPPSPSLTAASTAGTTYTPLPPRSRARPSSPRRGPPTPLPPLGLPVLLAYPVYGPSTPVSLFVPSPYVGGTPYLPTTAIGGHVTSAQILREKVGYPAPGTSGHGTAWPPSSEEMRELRRTGVVRSGEIVLAPWLIPSPHPSPPLRWDIASEPTAHAMRVTSRGTLMRIRGEGSVWDAPVAKGVSGSGMVGRVLVQVVKGGNGEECVQAEFEVGSDEEGGELTVGELLIELHAWARSPIFSSDVETMCANEPSQYALICQHYHARMQQERGGGNDAELIGEGLRVCDALEGSRRWWGAWVCYLGDTVGDGRGRWVLRVRLVDA